MNFCIITSSFPSHSADIVQAPFLIEFIEGLKRRGHQIFVFTQDRSGAKEEFLDGVRVKWFSWVGSKRPLVHLNPSHPFDCLRIGHLLYKGKKALLPFVRENQISACLALWVLPGGFFANHVYQRTGIPYSLWALGSDIYRHGKNPLLYGKMRRIIRDARAVFADGFELSRRVKERFGRDCFFLATTRTLKKAGPESPDPSEDVYHFLYVGRLEKVKGVDLLLQAMALLKEEGLSIHLTIVGGGQMEEWARDFIHKNGLEKQVALMGNVPDETLAHFYASLDCVVIPSRSESIPLVFSEALNFDKRMIVTDVGDMGMLGRQYGVAWVVPPEDPIALREVMKRRVESQNKGQEKEDKGKRAELRRLFNIETSVERFLSDYA